MEKIGSLNDPLTGRTWDPKAVLGQIHLRMAFFLGRGMSSGDLVFLHHGNTLEFFADLLAIWGLGGCAVPIDPRLSDFEVETLARAAKPAFSLWCGNPDETRTTCLSSMGVQILDTSEPAVKPHADAVPTCSASLLSPDQDAMILFTSGTTGQPKGVVHTHRSLRARWGSLRQHHGVEKFRRSLCLLPTYFGHGLICNSLFPWLSGQDLYIVPPFRHDVIVQLGTLLDAHKIDFMSSVPSMWRLELRTSKPPQARTLQRVFCGSAPLSAHL